MPMLSEILSQLEQNSRCELSKARPVNTLKARKLKEADLYWKNLDISANDLQEMLQKSKDLSLLENVDIENLDTQNLLFILKSLSDESENSELIEKQKELAANYDQAMDELLSARTEFEKVKERMTNPKVSQVSQLEDEVDLLEIKASRIRDDIENIDTVELETLKKKLEMTKSKLALLMEKETSMRQVTTTYQGPLCVERTQLEQVWEATKSRLKLAKYSDIENVKDLISVVKNKISDKLGNQIERVPDIDILKTSFSSLLDEMEETDQAEIAKVMRFLDEPKPMRQPTLAVQLIYTMVGKLLISIDRSSAENTVSLK